MSLECRAVGSMQCTVRGVKENMEKLEKIPSQKTAGRIRCPARFLPSHVTKNVLAAGEAEGQTGTLEFWFEYCARSSISRYRLLAFRDWRRSLSL